MTHNSRHNHRTDNCQLIDIFLFLPLLACNFQIRLMNEATLEGTRTIVIAKSSCPESTLAEQSDNQREILPLNLRSKESQIETIERRFTAEPEELKCRNNVVECLNSRRHVITSRSCRAFSRRRWRSANQRPAECTKQAARRAGKLEIPIAQYQNSIVRFLESSCQCPFLSTLSRQSVPFFFLFFLLY